MLVAAACAEDDPIGSLDENACDLQPVDESAAPIADEHDAGEDEHGGTYGFDAFRAAVVNGLHGDGEQLSDDMPRWTMSEADLQDLAEYLQSFETP